MSDGVDGDMVRALYASRLTEGAVPRLVGQRLGRVTSQDGTALDVEITFEAGPSVLYDGLIVPDGGDAAGTLGIHANVLNFLREQYRHGKPLLAIGNGVELLVSAWVTLDMPDDSLDPGLIVVDAVDSAAGLDMFNDALATHRVYGRETDPPQV